MNDKKSRLAAPFDDASFANVMGALAKCEPCAEVSRYHLSLYLGLLIAAAERVIECNVTDNQSRFNRDDLRQLISKLKGVVK